MNNARVHKQYLEEDIHHILYNRGGYVPIYKEGNVGIEIEVEGRSLPIVGGHWTTKEDHSLRGEAKEYVLREPLTTDKLPNALIHLEKGLAKSQLQMSHRTSVHVHMNCEKLFAQEVYNLIALFFFFEEFLISFSGEERKGNMYCLKCSDAEYLPMRICQTLIEQQYFSGLAGDDIRYSALNLKAISQFGSAEFRSFRGTTSANEILEWVAILTDLIKATEKFNNPLEIITLYEQDKIRLINTVFGKSDFSLYVLSYPDFQTSMHKGYQYAFEMAHASPLGWVDLKQVRENRLKGIVKPTMQETKNSPKKKQLESFRMVALPDDWQNRPDFDQPFNPTFIAPALPDPLVVENLRRTRERLTQQEEETRQTLPQEEPQQW